MKTKTSKRILSVKLKRICDESPDTSHLGEYSNRATSEFSIDRMHSEDCQSLETNHRETVDKLERIIRHIVEWQKLLSSESAEWEELEDAYQALVSLQDDAMQCDCGERGDMRRHEYRYFNPSFNYIDKHGKALPGNTPEDVRKYVREDYERMERLNAGDWCYIGIRAQAEVVLAYGGKSSLSDTVTTGGFGPVQTVTSGGLWGIESDSDKSYFAEVHSEELANLKDQLLAVGFSRRAISLAFKSAEEVDA